MKKVAIMRIMFFVFCSIALMNTTAKANNVLIFGEGSESCGSFLQAMSDDEPNTALMHNGKKYVAPSTNFGTWIMGWLSAINYSAPKEQMQIKTDYLGAMMSVKKRCEEHPERSVVWAVQDFVLSQTKEH